MNRHDEYRRVHREVYGEPGNPPRAWIQWKGTAPCIDLHCVCGVHGHIDDEMFLYVVQCAGCFQVYAVGEEVPLIPLTAKQAEVIGHEPILFSDPEAPHDRPT